MSDLITADESARVEEDFPIQRMDPHQMQSLSKEEQEEYEIQHVVMTRRRNKAMGPIIYARCNEDNGIYMSSIYPGYRIGELLDEVTFLSADWDDEEECFVWELKTKEWCLKNGFHEIEPGTWSGDWYFDKFPNEKPCIRPLTQFDVLPEERINRNVNEDDFLQVRKLKDEGNRSYNNKRYKQAIKKYDQALDLLGGEDYTMFLKGYQRQEAVKILSNKAECNIQLENYTDASLNGSSALALNKGHVKSLLRRAKANYVIIFQMIDLIDPDLFMVGIFEEDVDKVIQMGGIGAEEAKELKEMMKKEIAPIINSHNGFRMFVQ